MKRTQQRRTPQRTVVAWAAGAVLVLAGSTAFAQAPAAGGGGGGDAEGYGYTFDDDPLNAGGFGPNDATIRVRARAARTTLIRPRTSFVPEMLKSVENL
jgi:hypothetical protein